MKKLLYISLTFIILCFFLACSGTQNRTKPPFRVISFYNEIKDSEQAHFSFVNEANRWFSKMAALHNFVYDSTNNWSNLNSLFLKNYQVVIFLNARPDSFPRRDAFRKFMEKGGAWMGFHFAGFALTPSDIPQNWDWYQNKFLASGEYQGNTWKPTTSVLRVEDSKHPSTVHLPETFISAPNEWYRWKNDLRNNPDIEILLSIDSTSFPLGTSPKLYEIWHSGYYPVVWSNKSFKMIYFNMGHNDIDSTGKDLSHTFGNKYQDQLFLDALLWLGRGK